ncbi:myosin-2 heavy chain-like [Triticum dicoccoides]|uniref:myosin-2 heavy chain-like n=1 Tax=Triticum dicoccoides TaxID=85692 RepID=UPI00188E7A09|nr:myosin-2 heavy chain-like [Triticum dicoccoides]
MDTAPDTSPSPPEIQSGGLIQTPTAPEPISPTTMAVKSPRRNETPSISSTSFSLARSLEDEVGAGKEAMLHAEQMETRLKELLISNETLKTNIRKTCESGTKYLGLKKELEKVRQELDEEQAKTIRLEREKTAMEESVKKILEEKDTALAKAKEEADAMSKKANDRLEELQEAREMKDHYLKVAEDMKKQIEALKASESEWHTKYVERSDLAEMTKMKYEKDLGELKQGISDTETFLVGQLDEVKQRLEVFCSDPIMEAHKVQKELEAYGIDIKETPWASTRVAEAVIRLEERAKAAKSVIAQVRKSMKGINATLHPGEEVDEALPICLQQLEQVPGRVSRCKKSVARCGANVALALTRVHFPEINEAKLQNIGVGNPEGEDFEDHMQTFIRTANQIASLIGLDLSVEPARVPDTSEEELVQEEEKNK